jgi:hypothetical protein
MIEMTTKSLKHKPSFLGLCFIGCIFLGLLILSSCKKAEEKEAVMTVSKEEISVDAIGGEITNRIKSDQDWRIIDINADWLTVEPLNGKANELTVTTFTILKNTVDAVRTATVTIKSGATLKEITITQKKSSGYIDPSTIDVSKIYIPQDLKSNDFYSSSSTWFYGRSKQSDHFIVFWAKDYDEYGVITPTTYSNSTYKVNIDDLLSKAEQFYSTEVNTLKFVTPGASKTDKYKMMIFLNYQTEWLATGAGYDDIIGSLWVSPSTCQPAGSVIAHEIGHCFQYQVFCDHGGNSGWRYGFGGNGGNAFWEQTAQWQSFQSYPGEIFTNYYFADYVSSCYKSTFHEDPRYANYFIHYYWAEKHGVDFIGKLWQQAGANGQEDPAQAYMRITGITLSQYNDEQFDYARKMVTWDLDAIRNYGKNYIGLQTCNLNKTTDGYWQIAAANCIENHGYNVIRLNVPAEGTTVSADFAGIAGESGYNAVNVAFAGWRYGYVALQSDGTRVYSDVFSDKTGTATFTVPANCTDLWFVVSGAPTTYWPHAWDDNAANDEQWPYKVKFTNTNLYGVIEFTDKDQPHDTSFVFNVSFPANSSAYNGTTVSVDITKLCYAFVLNSTEIVSNLGLPATSQKIKFYGINKDGSYYNSATANGYGHWFDKDGNVVAWSSTGTNRVYSEFDEKNFKFTIGQHPGRCTSGDVYKIKQAMVYSPATGQYYTATFEFNITITN